MENTPGNLEGLAETSTKILRTENEAQKPAPPPAATSASTSTIQAAPAPQEKFPDPDEDDLDDLDGILIALYDVYVLILQDMLDEFTPPVPEPKAPASAKLPVPNAEPTDATNGLTDAEFAEQLESSMAQLIQGLDSDPDMATQFQDMMKQFGDIGSLDSTSGPSVAPTPSSQKTTKNIGSKAKSAAALSTGGEESFQETIKKTMERMRESGDQATAAATTEPSDDMLAELMKAMQSSGLDSGEGSEEDFSKMLLGMMEQLTNKDILYEPMKELDDKYPDWIEKNGGKVDEGDLKRYKEQQVYVREITARFEKKGYSDDNAADREYIVERMQKVKFLFAASFWMLSLITFPRCKQRARPLQISLVIWLQLKKLLVRQKKAAHNSNKKPYHAERRSLKSDETCR
jgi:peroxin-19